MTRYSRSDWGARASRGGPGPLDPARVVGLVFHWPAMSSPLRTVAAVMAGLRGWQAYHMDSHGWSDIAYQVAVDQAGNRYDLRGLRTTPGANGDTAANVHYGAVLLVLAPGEEPTPAMVTEVRAVVTDHRDLFARSRDLLGHSDVRPEPTACPGPAAMRLIRAGTFNPTQSEEDDMPAYTDWSQKDRDALARDVANANWQRGIPMGKGNDPIPAQALLRQARNQAAAAKVDPAALAAAVVAALPAGSVSEATVVAGVKKALAELVNGD